MTETDGGSKNPVLSDRLLRVRAAQAVPRDSQVQIADPAEQGGRGQGDQLSADNAGTAPASPEAEALADAERVAFPVPARVPAQMDTTERSRDTHARARSAVSSVVQGIMPYVRRLPRATRAGFDAFAESRSQRVSAERANPRPSVVRPYVDSAHRAIAGAFQSFGRSSPETSRSRNETNTERGERIVLEKEKEILRRPPASWSEEKVRLFVEAKGEAARPKMTLALSQTEARVLSEDQQQILREAKAVFHSRKHKNEIAVARESRRTETLLQWKQHGRPEDVKNKDSIRAAFEQQTSSEIMVEIDRLVAANELPLGYALAAMRKEGRNPHIKKWFTGYKETRIDGVEVGKRFDEIAWHAAVKALKPYFDRKRREKLAQVAVAGLAADALDVAEARRLAASTDATVAAAAQAKIDTAIDTAIGGDSFKRQITAAITAGKVTDPEYQQYRALVARALANELEAGSAEFDTIDAFQRRVTQGGPQKKRKKKK